MGRKRGGPGSSRERRRANSQLRAIGLVGATDSTISGPQIKQTHDEQKTSRTSNTSERLVPVLTALLQSTAVIAFVTGAMFYFGVTYYDRYFFRISEATVFPPLSTSDYLVKSFGLFNNKIAIAFALSLQSAYLSYVYQSFFTKEVSEIRIVRILILLFRWFIVIVAISLVCISIYESDNNRLDISLLFLSILSVFFFMMLVVFIWSTIFSTRLSHIYERRYTLIHMSVTFRTTFALFSGALLVGTICIITPGIATQLADIDATAWLSEPTFSVVRFVDESPDTEDDRVYRVVILRGGNYYLFPVDESGQLEDVMIILPESQIRSATVLPYDAVFPSLPATPEPSPGPVTLSD